MNDQEYKAALGELQRLEALQKSDPAHPQQVREALESLRADIAAYENGTRGTGTPPGGHGT